MNLREAVVLLAQHNHWGLQDLLDLTEDELMDWLDTTKTLLAEQQKKI